MGKQFDDGTLSIEFANGMAMSQIGFGTYELPIADTQRAILLRFSSMD